MKFKSYLYIVLLLTICSCSNSQPNDKKYKLDPMQLNFNFHEIDSLSELFREKEFRAVIDTFYFESDSLPTIFSFIEYYSVSTYSVSNIKCVMAGGKNKGIVCLFKFNYPKEIWELEWQIQTNVDKIKQNILTLQNSPYWLQNTLIAHDIRYTGDFFRFSYLEDNKKNERLEINPDVELIDQFKTVVTSE